MSKYNLGICSGYFNPLHIGHLDYLKQAKSQCELLYVIINNDDAVTRKGAIPLLDQNTRLQIVSALKFVDSCFLSFDSDLSVAETLEYIINKNPEKTMAFFNGGDRTKKNKNLAEERVCKKHNVDMIYIESNKVNSSSKIIERAIEYDKRARENSEI